MTNVYISHMDVSKRVAELNAMPKDMLARMHVNYGGLMGFNTYLKWTKDELVNTVLQDEAINASD